MTSKRKCFLKMQEIIAGNVNNEKKRIEKKYAVFYH